MYNITNYYYLGKNYMHGRILNKVLQGMLNKLLC